MSNKLNSLPECVDNSSKFEYSKMGFRLGVILLLIGFGISKLDDLRTSANVRLALTPINRPDQTLLLRSVVESKEHKVAQNRDYRNLRKTRKP